MIKKLIRRWANHRSYRLAVFTANTLRSKTFKKYFVIFMNGEYRAYSKQHLKNLHKQGFFKAGVKFRQIEKMAAYTTK